MDNTKRPADTAKASSDRTQPELRPRGLYVHIPFCQTKCPYCDFNTYARIEDLIPRYVDALQTEISLWGALLHHPPLETVFFGGGTPSYLPTDRIVAIFEAIRGAFGVSVDAEISLEANPGDLGPAKLSALRRVGVNRLSIGVQSLDDKLLETRSLCTEAKEQETVSKRQRPYSHPPAQGVFNFWGHIPPDSLPEGPAPLYSPDGILR